MQGVNRIRIAIHPFFLSLCIQLCCNFLRDALPIFHTLCLRISFQRGIPQICRLPGPYFKFTFGHQPASDAGKIFFVSPLVNLPDIVILHFTAEAAARADLTAGLAILSRCRLRYNRRRLLPGFCKNQRSQLAQRFGANPFCSPFMNST